MQQLDLFDFISTVPELQTRPAHKPYEPNAPDREEYIRLGFLSWSSLHHNFDWFLIQPSPDHKMQKARIWHWEGRDIKVPAYRWRMFEGYCATYNEWCILFNKHLKGWTTDTIDHPDLELHFIDEMIKEAE